MPRGSTDDRIHGICRNADHDCRFDSVQSCIRNPICKYCLTFTGFHDPYAKGLLGDDDLPGPIVSLLQARSFDLVYLLATPNTERNTQATAAVLSNIRLREVSLPLQDPTEYSAILKQLRGITTSIVEEFPGADYFVSVASGTPQMHACWALLTASGEFPARILHIRPNRFVTAERPSVSEIDLTRPEFPVVRIRDVQVEAPNTSTPDIRTALAELELTADHPKMVAALGQAAALAPSTAPVLILGATGTGKELLAKFIHRMSGRPRDRFIALNCAAIPKDLAESILFGHKKGSFTGAICDQVGKFEQADKGTLFLDELGELPLAAQAKLLRVLQDGLVEPIGAKTPRKIDVRIVAATNQDLGKAILQKDFRDDLYYRLNVGEIRLPPLRERRSDIPKIALNILDYVNKTLRRPKRLSPAALSRLQGHAWPGNVRELQNVIERSAPNRKRGH